MLARHIYSDDHFFRSLSNSFPLKCLLMVISCSSWIQNVSEPIYKDAALHIVPVCTCYVHEPFSECGLTWYSSPYMLIAKESGMGWGGGQKTCSGDNVLLSTREVTGTTFVKVAWWSASLTFILLCLVCDIYLIWFLLLHRNTCLFIVGVLVN